MSVTSEIMAVLRLTMPFEEPANILERTKMGKLYDTAHMA